uniref:Uncharacterized protein n=1 Tax=Arundo donax TaxID=35708 RepID=A0A0A9CAB3_ARUDO
MASALRPST